MSTSTIDSMTARTGVTVLDHIDPTGEVPVVSAAAAQGDVSILRVTTPAATTPMPSRVDVVRGEAGGNTHAIYPDGPGVRCDVLPPSIGTTLTVARLVVDEGSVAYLGHPEHAFAGIGAVVMHQWGSDGNPLALVAVVLVCAVVGALVALPALRLKGLYLALITLGLAPAVRNTLRLALGV